MVHICTPHHLHAPMAIAALAAGVHVLLEKPVATTVSDGEAVIAGPPGDAGHRSACASRTGTTTRRAEYESCWTGARAVLGGRAAVTWFRDESYYRRRPWRGTWAEGGGGVLINQAIHTLDLLQWYLGDVGTGPRPRRPTVAAGPGAGRGHRGHPVAARRRGRLDLLRQQRLRGQRPGDAGAGGRARGVRLDTDLTVNYAHGTTDVVVETQLAAAKRPTGAHRTGY